jgi:hypothetical protein
MKVLPSKDQWVPVLIIAFVAIILAQKVMPKVPLIGRLFVQAPAA